MYPALSNKLAKKKDVNKSDAILIARYFSETRLKIEIVGNFALAPNS